MPCNSTPCNCNNNCNDCGNTHIQTHICNPCSTPPPCDCPVVDLSTDCSVYTGDPIICNDVVVVPQNTNVTISLQNIVAWVCSKFADLNLIIKNVGNGVGIFKGTTLIGEKELKSLTSTDNSVAITSNTNTIDLAVNYSETNPCFYSGNNSVSVEYDFDDRCFNLQTCVTSPANSSISVELDEGCFNVDLDNLQKVISDFPYTLTSADDKYTIFINNVSNDVVINVPNGLVDNFSCSFFQEGTGEVTIQASGTATVTLPSTLDNIIKEQYGWVMVEKKLNTNNYFLAGRLKSL